MAKEKKKDKEAKIVLERTYTIPLRREFIMVPRYKRSPRAIDGIQKFLSRHMKSDTIKIGKYLNLAVWEHGIKNPPHHIKVVAKKDEEGKVFAELEGAPVEVVKEPVKGKKAVKATETPAEQKVEETKEQHAEQAKEIQKEEIKELQKEQPKKHAPKEAVSPKQINEKPQGEQGRSEMRKP